MHYTVQCTRFNPVMRRHTRASTVGCLKALNVGKFVISMRARSGDRGDVFGGQHVVKYLNIHSVVKRTRGVALQSGQSRVRHRVYRR